MKKVIILGAAVAALASLFACSHDDDHDHSEDGGAHTSQYPSCNAITQACHSVDVGTGPIHDCHDLAHAATSDAPCATEKDRCLKLCAAAEADGGGDATGDASSDATGQ